MKIASIFAVLALAQTLAAQVQIQPDREAGDFLFKLPPGWKEARNGKSTALIAPTINRGTTTTIVLGTYEIETDLPTSFHKSWDALQKQYRVQRPSPIASQRLPGGNDAMAVSAMAVDKKGKQWAAVFLLARNGSRSEAILFMTDDLQPKALMASKSGLAAFLASVHFSAGESGSDRVPGDSR